MPTQDTTSIPKVLLSLLHVLRVNTRQQRVKPNAWILKPAITPLMKATRINVNVIEEASKVQRVHLFVMRPKRAISSMKWPLQNRLHVLRVPTKMNLVAPTASMHQKAITFPMQALRVKLDVLLVHSQTPPALSNVTKPRLDTQ
jgi:hypothetical protein